jgi:hypothetical protein
MVVNPGPLAFIMELVKSPFLWNMYAFTQMSPFFSWMGVIMLIPWLIHSWVTDIFPKIFFYREYHNEWFIKALNQGDLYILKVMGMSLTLVVLLNMLMVLQMLFKKNREISKYIECVRYNYVCPVLWFGCFVYLFGCAYVMVPFHVDGYMTHTVFRKRTHYQYAMDCVFALLSGILIIVNSVSYIKTKKMVHLRIKRCITFFWIIAVGISVHFTDGVSRVFIIGSSVLIVMRLIKYA